MIIGAIRQEILSGYSDLNKFEQLKTKLSYFEITPILDEDYIIAAKMNAIVYATALAYDADLITCDPHFEWLA